MSLTIFEKNAIETEVKRINYAKNGWAWPPRVRSEEELADIRAELRAVRQGRQWTPRRTYAQSPPLKFESSQPRDEVKVFESANGIVFVTKELLQRGMSKKGAWSQEHLSALGVPWPLKSGWRKKLLGSKVSPEAVARFLALKDSHSK